MFKNNWHVFFYLNMMFENFEKWIWKIVVILKMCIPHPPIFLKWHTVRPVNFFLITKLWNFINNFFSNWDIFFVSSILKCSYKILDDTDEIWEWRNENTDSNEFCKSGACVTATGRVSALLPHVIRSLLISFLSHQYVRWNNWWCMNHLWISHLYYLFYDEIQ